MKKILVPGTKRVHLCPDCGCKYSYEKEDVKIEESKYHGGGDTYYVECPQCHERNYIQQARTSFNLL